MISRSICFKHDRNDYQEIKVNGILFAYPEIMIGCHFNTCTFFFLQKLWKRPFKLPEVDFLSKLRRFHNEIRTRVIVFTWFIPCFVFNIFPPSTVTLFGVLLVVNKLL